MYLSQDSQQSAQQSPQQPTQPPSGHTPKQLFVGSFFITALVSLAPIPIACQCTPQNTNTQQDAGERDAGAELDAGIVSNIPCQDDTEEEDCAILGAGHMCMNGGCMLMDIHAPAVAQPEARDTALDYPRLTDQDPDPTVFVASMSAVETRKQLVQGTSGAATAETIVWQYRDDHAPNPTQLNPLIDVAVGTRVKIHFTNRLPVATTIHWHGLVLPAAMDGANHTHNPTYDPAHDPAQTAPSTHTPITIAPNASFDFDFITNTAASYWFHPHINADIQIENGLYAPFIVRSSEDDHINTQVFRERVIMLDDILLDTNQQIVPFVHGSAMNPDGTMSFEGMMGRQGDHVLFNQQENPFLDAVAGTTERWRIVNAAGARFFKLAIPNHTFVQIGSDGGLLPQPRILDTLLLAPGERMDVVISWQGALDTQIPLQTLHHNRGHDMADPGPLRVATIRFVNTTPPPNQLPHIPSYTSPFQTLAFSGDTPSQKIILSETVLRGGKVGFSINEELYPDFTPLFGRVGTTEMWEVINDTHMDHPFHLHGSFFQVLSFQEKGQAVQPSAFAEWKDTVIIPPKTTLHFVTRYENAGLWMFHCHILDHAERGMMSAILVE